MRTKNLMDGNGLKEKDNETLNQNSSIGFSLGQGWGQDRHSLFNERSILWLAFSI